MSLLNLGYGLSGFMQGYDQQRLQSALMQQYANQLRQQQQQDQAASLLFPALLGGGTQTPMPGQPSVPQFGGGPFGGAGSAMPPAAAQPSSPPQLGGGPTFSGTGDYGGGSPPGMGDYYAPAPGSGGGGISPFDTPPDMRHTVNPYWPDKDFGTGPPIMPSGPRVSASRYGGMAVDPSFGPVLGRDPVPQDPGDRFGPPGLGPMASDATLLPEFSPGGSGQYTYDSSGNLIDQVTGSPVSSSRAATPTTDIPPAATAPSSPPGDGSGSSAAAQPSLYAGGDDDSGGRRLPLSLGTGADTSAYGGSKADYIRQQAAKYPNINPNDAIRTVMGEGGVGRFQVGDAGTSGGPFQLHVGGGLGDTFQRQTGLNPLDPRNEKATIDWTLNYVSKNLGGKFPSDVWHGNRGGGGYGGGTGGGGAGLGAGGGGGDSGTNAILQQAIGLIQKGMAPVPESLYGRMSTQQLARQIENANPGADPVVKMLALERGMKLLAPEDRLQTQMYMQQHQDLFREGLAILQSTLTQGRQTANEPWQVLTDPSTNQQYRYNPRSAQATTLAGEPYTPGGAQKIGTPRTNTSPLTDAAAERYAKIFAETGYLPPGIARSSAAIAQIMNKTGDVGTPGQFVANLATRQADTKSLANMTKIADAATSYENTAIRNFDQALRYSDKLSTTDLGPWLNKWVLTGETAAGDPTAPAYVVALLTAANEYAKVMSGGTGAAPSTEGSRREAYELFSPYLAKGQIKEVISVAKREMENRREELYSGVDDIKSRLRSAGSDKPMSRGHEPGTTDQPAPEGGAIKLDENGNPVQ